MVCWAAQVKEGKFEWKSKREHMKKKKKKERNKYEK